MFLWHGGGGGGGGATELWAHFTHMGAKWAAKCSQLPPSNLGVWWAAAALLGKRCPGWGVDYRAQTFFEIQPILTAL